MNERAASRGKAHLTLGLCVVLHAFTHAYAVALVPLYILMKTDLSLSGVKAAALVVTLYGIVYNLGSYAAGMLADRFDRRLLLGVGLIGNAAAVMGIGLTREYPVILALAAAGGVFGTLFHPAANALVCALYPEKPGTAIGLLGIGSGLGFFAGPQYAGWRAQHAMWHWGNVSQWQKPCVELGAAGVVCGILFLLFGSEAVSEMREVSPKPGKKLSRGVLLLAAVLGWRDFAALGTISLTSIFLQKACGKSVEEAGFIIGAMMLLAIVVNPIAAHLSGGKRRLPALAGACAIGGMLVASTPFWPAAMVLIPLCAYQTMQMGSYAISDSAMLERVAPAVRGRVVGVFLSAGGTWAGLSAWCMGFWTDRLGSAASAPAGYVGPFAALGVMMLVAAFSPFCVRRLGEVSGTVSPAEEISPRTMEGMV